ncbi:MAG: protein kinase [Planctomycetes bacterium]|nr:protein kinase [Planctomycetota bacterium]
MLRGQNIGPFHIEKELGSGAMGTVYRARYTEDDRLVALKLIAFGLTGNESALARFEREAVILKQLKHPNIVRLFATGKWKGTPFFAMEYVDGESLDRVIARRDRFSWQETIDLGKQLCAALQHAHERGIIHRDLKPSNLMITKDGVLKLTDFGIAKDIDVTAITGAHNTIGTAAYMSPEQCRGEKTLSDKSDLYSLGVVFFELLVGRKPFVADSSVDMFLMHVNEPAPRVRNQPGCLDIPQAFDTLIHQLMEKKPENRPRDAAMVLEALEEVEQKELARLSRGEEVAKARLVDSVETAPMDEKDLEAARSIRAAGKKKKLKKKETAFYRRGWFVGIGSVAIVLTTALIFWLLLRPDSPAEMLAAIEKAKNPDAKAIAAKKYLDTYGKSTDPKLADKTEWAKGIYWEGKVAKRESQLLKRHKIGLAVEEGDDPDAYSKTMSALTAEEDGDVVAARRTWAKLIETFQNDAKEEKALWGWVAAKRLKDLTEVEAREKHLEKVVKDSAFEDRDFKLEDEMEARAAEAMRLERFGDGGRAFDRWERFAKDIKGKQELRVWYLLAGKKIRELDPKKPAGDERKTMIVEKLRKAEETFPEAERRGDRIMARDARNTCRDIRDLYADDAPLKDEVKQARMLLQNNPK